MTEAMKKLTCHRGHTWIGKPSNHIYCPFCLTEDEEKRQKSKQYIQGNLEDKW